MSDVDEQLRWPKRVTTPSSCVRCADNVADLELSSHRQAQAATRQPPDGDEVPRTKCKAIPEALTLFNSPVTDITIGETQDRTTSNLPPIDSQSLFPINRHTCSFSCACHVLRTVTICFSVSTTR